DFQFKPENGWKANSVKVDGVTQTNLSNYTIERIVRDHEIEIEFVVGGPINPQTGDNSNIVPWLWMMLSVLVIAGVVYMKKLRQE
ncbi:LPXTG cell wall anchor domain-containing protein, partial [Eubacteriales bacterium OttesenSCG-928-M02]|nr:LPXTG cell wall anchor domain-containing protein [Eubacteriales bacterium OttesenSCG-928-M02]